MIVAEIFLERKIQKADKNLELRQWIDGNLENKTDLRAKNIGFGKSMEREQEGGALNSYEDERA
jgi:hypothetical protein